MWIDDEILKRCDEQLAWSCWLPKTPMVVLGSSNRADLEVKLNHCHRDGIPVLKRYGGGGTVVLYSGCVVVSLGTWVRQQFQNKYYFNLLNQTLIDCLALNWPRLAGLSQQGLSDIVWEDQKVAGTSLFRSRHYLLYQASILVDLKLDLVERFLEHPSKEPDYRNGRCHGEFLTGLSDLEPTATPASVQTQLSGALEAVFQNHFQNELVTPESRHFKTLLARAEGRLGKAVVSV